MKSNEIVVKLDYPAVPIKAPAPVGLFEVGQVIHIGGRAEKGVYAARILSVNIGAVLCQFGPIKVPIGLGEANARLAISYRAQIWPKRVFGFKPRPAVADSETTFNHTNSRLTACDCGSIHPEVRVDHHKLLKSQAFLAYLDAHGLRYPAYSRLKKALREGRAILALKDLGSSV